MKKRDEDERALVLNRLVTNPDLCDGSKLKKTLRVWSTTDTNDDEKVCLIEAMTTNDQVVFASSGNMSTRLGRPVTEIQKKEDFHIIGYEPEITRFVNVNENSTAIIATDTDGEIWLLCGY